MMPMTEPQPAHLEEDEIDLRELFGTLKRGWFTIVMSMLFALLLAGIYLYFSRPTYSSNVIIALEGEKSQSKLGELLVPTELIGVGMGEERLQLAKVTLLSKKFIGTIIDKLNVDREYFIVKNFRKVEFEKFDNLKFDIHYTNPELYGEDFEITPIDAQTFRLRVDAIQYNQIHTYSKKIQTPHFTLRVIKTQGVDPYSTLENNSTLQQYIDRYTKKYELDKKHYIFRSFNHRQQEERIIKNLNVVDLQSDSILKITYQDTLPQRAQRVVEEIAHSFIDYNLKNKTADLEQTLDFLNKQIHEIRQSLQKQEEKLKEYQEKSGSAIMSQGSNILETMDKKEDLINKVGLQIQAVENFRRSLEQDILNSVVLVSAGIDTRSIQPLMDSFLQTEETIRELMLQQENIEKSITNNPQIASLIQDLKNKKTLLQSLLTDFTTEHPQVIEQQQEVDNTINQIHANIVANLERLRKNKAVAQSTMLSNMEMVQKSLQDRLRLLQSDIREKQALLASMPSKTLKNENLKRGFELNEKIYTFLLQRKIEIEISKASTIANTKILENAYIPEKPEKPKKSLILMVGVILGLILGIIRVLVRGFMDTKIRNKKDLEPLTDISIYGVLPHIKDRRFFEEALRTLRTNLQFVISKGRCTRILISSTIPKEGKTTIAAGLAKVLSEANKRVLVMDLDLRKARLHQEFALRNKVGISNYLSSDMDLESLIVPIKGSKNLHFLPAGPIAPNPSELLLSPKLAQAISTLESMYDYIIYDTAPIGIVADTKLILKYSDIVLLVVRANVAEKQFISDFRHLKEHYHINSSGIILNDVKQIGKKHNYGYGYGYGYGDKG